MWWIELPLSLAFGREAYRPIDATGEAVPRGDPAYAPELWASVVPTVHAALLRNSSTAFTIGGGAGLAYLAPLGPDSASRLSLPRLTWMAALEPRLRLGGPVSLGLRTTVNPAELLLYQVTAVAQTDEFEGGFVTTRFAGVNAHALLLVRVSGGTL